MDFYNISNHPSTGWSKAQLDAARALGTTVVDVLFPNVPPTATSKEVETLAWDTLELIPKKSVVMIQGEASLAFAMVMCAHIKHIQVFVATTERRVTETVNVDGKTVKTATFEFVQFRDVLACGSHAMNCLIQAGL